MENKIDFNIGEQIKAYRTEARMTQEQLAQAIGVKRSVVSKYENGIIEPSLSQIQNIAKAIGISWYELIGTGDEFSALQNLSDLHPGFEFVYSANGDLVPVSHELIKKMVAVMPSLNTPLGQLLHCFNRLNQKGQKIAIQRVNELGKIPEYRENVKNSNKICDEE